MLVLLLHASLLLCLCSIAVEVQDGLQRLLGQVILQQSLLALGVMNIGGLCSILTVSCMARPIRNIREFIILKAICLLILLPRTAIIEIGVVH